MSKIHCREYCLSLQRFEILNKMFRFNSSFASLCFKLNFQSNTIYHESMVINQNVLTIARTDRLTRGQDKVIR